MARRLNLRIGSTASTKGLSQYAGALKRTGIQAKVLAGTLRKTEQASKRSATAARQATAAAKKDQAATNRQTAAKRRATAAINTTTRATKRATATTKRYTKAMHAQNVQTSKASALVRRLLSAMIIYGAMNQAILGFKNLIKTSLGFNKNIEAAQLGIAALITASVQVTNSYGKVVGIAEKFAFAQGEAARQAELLRRDALLTEATYDQLLSTFQIGIAPGISGGLNLDQIREFTLRISQAATALNMQQVHLAEEIRSILQGTIKITTTRIAAALQITNADIRKWRQSGDLAQELFQRFEAFKESGKYLKQTMAGLTGRVRDAFSQMLGEAGKGLFEDAKESLKKIFELLTNIDNQGMVSFDPRVLAVFREFFRGIREAVSYARTLSDSLTFEKAFVITKKFSALLVNMVKTIIAIAEGVQQAMSFLSDVSKILGRVFKFMGVFGISITFLITKVTAMALVWAVVASTITSILFLFKTFTVVIGKILATIKTLRAVMWSMAAAANSTLIPWLLLAGTVAATAKIIHNEFSKNLGVSNDIVLSMMVGFQTIWNVAKAVCITLKSGFTIAGLALASVWESAYGLMLKIERKYLETKVLALKFAGEQFAAAQAEVDKIDILQAKQAIEAKRRDDLRAQAIIDQAKAIKNAWSFEEITKGYNDMLNDVKSGEGMSLLKKKIGEAFKGTGISEMFSNLMSSMTGDKGLSSELQKELDAMLEAMRKKEAEAEAAAKRRLKMERALEPLEAGRIEKLEQEIDARIKLNDLYNQHIAAQEMLAFDFTGDSGLDPILQLEQEIAAREEIKRLIAEQTLSLYEKQKAIDANKESLRLLQLEAEGGPWNALEAGLLQFAYNTQSTFEAIAASIEGMLDKLADTISTTIVDSFDPNKEVDLKQRFGQFLQDISKMIIQMFMRIAIAKAVLSLVGGGAGSAGAAAGGMATGGPIKPRGATGHYTHAVGYAQGGSLRPKGLHPSDTVPIWAAPGEFMMKVSAVQKYGADVMAKINRGLIDPSALRGLSGTSRAIQSARSGGPGYAEGGEVSQTQQVAVGNGMESAGKASMNRSYIIANDETLDQLLNGGQGAMLRFFKENKDDINGSLKRS